ncbi:Pyruvate phosphate dikinase, PEP/pyruvate binding domain [Paenibacillus sp. 1_12]|nr:Pyruvate phosphate dikinase, PEP/pyruvate binding domain [Paenibacillus sp. 1_12]
MYTVTLNMAGHEHIQTVGSKALQLAKLTGQSVKVPGGFVITSNALERFLEANDLRTPELIGDFESKLIEARLPEDVYDEVAASFESMRGQSASGMMAVAVRSSSSAEDLEEASFAGQYETILNVTDLTHLLNSLKRCWASLFSARVRDYAQQKNVSSDMGSFPMGVLVQQMVQADVSGVIFSLNPVTHNEDEIIINASYGLGEAIVSGLVTPDSYVIGKTDGHIEKELGLKEVKIVAADKGTVELTTTEEEQNRFCLSDEHVAELAEQTRKIEVFYGMPVDIEFAIKDGHIYILQARPVTT